jgi:hypothetical protein
MWLKSRQACPSLTDAIPDEPHEYLLNFVDTSNTWSVRRNGGFNLLLVQGTCPKGYMPRVPHRPRGGSGEIQSIRSSHHTSNKVMNGDAALQDSH